LVQKYAGEEGAGGEHTWLAWSGHTRSWGSSRSLLHAKFVLMDDLFMTIFINTASVKRSGKMILCNCTLWLSRADFLSKT
jgi:hypothetical protein